MTIIMMTMMTAVMMMMMTDDSDNYVDVVKIHVYLVVDDRRCLNGSKIG